MNRREFVNFLAMIAAGAAALPDQIAAYRHYYEVNTPNTSAGLIAIDEVIMSGIAARSMRVKLDIMRLDEIKLPFAINAFGGIMLWKAGPDQKVMIPARELRWEIRSLDAPDDVLIDNVRAHMSYIDQNGVRRMKRFLESKGSLVPLTA